MDNPLYYEILKHYEKRFDQHGASFKGMDWPNEEDLSKRFDVMLDVVRPKTAKPATLLDLGCGVGLMLDHIKSKGLTEALSYRGVDLSEKMVTKARELHPEYPFESRDILKDPLPPKSVDYVIMNGLLTEKLSLGQGVMENFAREVIKETFTACRHGIAFNVMSTHVDWMREDLFHWSLDSAVAFLVAECSRHIIIRMDYGLYEYTVYVYRDAGK